MRQIICILLTISLMICLASCGDADRSDKQVEYEIAMIADSSEIVVGSIAEVAWESVESFAATNGISAECYMPKEPAKEAYLEAIKSAVENKAKIVVLAGSCFETTVFSAQGMYQDVYFLLIDGIPHDTGEKYGASANTIGVIFAEEQAGYLAGYAAVKDGYKKLGFMGGKEIPPVKRYGYGFVQGVAAAAQDMEQKVELSYKYYDTLLPSEDIEKEAIQWYNNEIELIFSCGGAVGHSVMAAAEQSGGKVIGADTDQSYISNSVITSAQKEIGVVVNDMLDSYVDGQFVGGTAFNYTVQNDGISLQMDKAEFGKFNKKDYAKVYNKLKENELELKKDTGVDSIKELTGEWVTIK